MDVYSPSSLFLVLHAEIGKGVCGERQRGWDSKLDLAQAFQLIYNSLFAALSVSCCGNCSALYAHLLSQQQYKSRMSHVSCRATLPHVPSKLFHQSKGRFMMKPSAATTLSALVSMFFSAVTCRHYYGCAFSTVWTPPSGVARGQSSRIPFRPTAEARRGGYVEMLVGAEGVDIAPGDRALVSWFHTAVCQPAYSYHSYTVAEFVMLGLSVRDSTAVWLRWCLVNLLQRTHMEVEVIRRVKQMRGQGSSRILSKLGNVYTDYSTPVEIRYESLIG